MMQESKETRQISRTGIIAVVMVLFFLSGISGLIYEVVWTRLLTYLFGASIYAVSTVLAAFMGGLALGSYIFGKLADRWEHQSLKAYAILEFLIGVAALLLLLLLKIVEPVFGFIYRHFTESFFILSLMRFLLCFIILLIPTTFMGGTLPLLSRFLARHNQTLGLRVGGLYSMNTFGAVTGCFLAGFYFIAYLGVRGTVGLAVFINIFVAFLGILLWRYVKHLPSEPLSEEKQAAPAVSDSASPYPQRTIKTVLILYFISGMIAMSYQVGWWRGLVFNFDILKNTTYAFTSMLSVFLIGLALGSAIMSRFVDRQHDPLRLFGLLQILLGVTGFLSVFIIYFRGESIAPFPYFDATGVNLIWWAAVLNMFTKTAAAIFLPTLLMGMLFPVVVKVCVERIGRIGVSVGRIYALNTIGGIIGSFLAGFFLIPFIGLGTGLIILSILNITIGFIAFLINPAFSRATKIIFAAGVLVVAGVMLGRAPVGASLQPVYAGEKLLYYREGSLATVAVVQSPLQNKTLYVDNVGVAGTDQVILTDQKSLAHIPMFLLGDAKSALTVGFGSGGASWSFTLYKELERIHCIEISETVLTAAPYLLESNHGILTLFDPRFRIILDDVRSYLRFTEQRYDIIATDCTDLRYKTNANLYDHEYFELCRERLTEDGMVVVWMPLAGLSDEAFRLTLRTFYRVFPDMSIWYMNNEPTHYILLLGTKKPLFVDYTAMQSTLSRPEIKQDLAELHLDDIDKILSCYVVGPDRIKDLVGDGAINTENYPYIEFHTPRYGYGEQPLVDNLTTMMKFRSNVMYIIETGTITEGEKKRLKTFIDAVPAIIEGIKAYRLLELEEATRHWMKAHEICPEDRAVVALLDFPELRKRVELFPFEVWSKFKLGEALMIQKRYPEAATLFTRIQKDLESIQPARLSADERLLLKKTYDYLAQCYEEAGRKSEAQELREKGDALQVPNS